MPDTSTTFNYSKGDKFRDGRGELLTVIDIDDRTKLGTRFLIIESAIEHRVFPCPDWLARLFADNGEWIAE